MEFSNRFDDAAACAFQVHFGQKKGPFEKPFIAHPLGVCSLVLQMGGNETQATVALLHDTIEKLSREELSERFGAEISRRAFLFETPPLSDPTDLKRFEGDPHEAWKLPRYAYQKHLSGLDATQLLVVAAEELQEMREWILDLRQARKQGRDLWAELEKPSSLWLWNYEEMGKVFVERLSARHPLASELYLDTLKDFKHEC